MELDRERAYSLIKAIPFMSKTIVDDTLYEKVLSFLTSVISKDHSIVTELINQGLFDLIKQAFDDKDQDYRVLTLCLRLLGQVVYYGGSPVFEKIKLDYSSFLKVTTLGLRASEAALRCASIEACRLFITCESGAQWLLDNNHANTFISIALLDQSNYVVTEACKLFSYLIENNKTLCERMDPSKQIKATLSQIQLEQSQLMSSLEFCWTIVNTKLESSLDYLRSTQLLYPLESLLYCNSRMVRARVIEILSVLFNWDNDILKTLGKSQSASLEQTFDTIFSLSMDMIENANQVDTLTTGISLMDCSFVIAKRIKDKSVEHCYTILLCLAYICLDKESEQEEEEREKKYVKNVKELLNKTSRSKAMKKSVLQSLLNVIDGLCQAYPNLIKNMKSVQLSLEVLDRQSLFSDQRVLKASLGLLTTSLYGFVKMNMVDSIPDIVSNSIRLLVDMLDKTALNCRSVGLVFESFDTLLSHDQIGILVVESDVSNAFVDSLSLKFLDTEWDIRDATIEFVGLLFKQPLVKTKISFALKYNLPLSVFNRIQDSEAYVRASALDVLQNMMKTKEGWEYIQQNKYSRELASTLPKLLYDSEAFVRRSTLDAILCLVYNRSCQGMKMEANSQDQQSLNSEIIRKLIDDQDPDVRIRACKLIESLWFLYKHEMHEQNKKRTVPSSTTTETFFHEIRPGPLLVQAVNDTQRLVRIEAVRVIENILQNEEDQGQKREEGGSGKRQFDNTKEDDKGEAFLELLHTVDIDQVKQTLDPEHLYEEAFDINADMMTHSIIPSNPDDDVNMLDCY